MPARVRHRRGHPLLAQQRVSPGALRTSPRPVRRRAAAPEFPANPKIAIIAFQQAVAATNEGQRNFAQLRTKFEPKQAALKAQSDEIDSLKKQLQDAGANLSEPERDSRLRTIDEKTKSLQRTAEDAQNEASGAMNDMYQQLAQKVYAVLDAYSNQNKFTIVLDTSAQQTPVLWANQGSDITKAVVDAYNAKSGVPRAARSRRQPLHARAHPLPATPAPRHGPARPSRRSRAVLLHLTPGMISLARGAQDDRKMACPTQSVRL